MSENEARTAGAQGGLDEVGEQLGTAGEELGTAAQQARRASAALLGSGRIGPGDAARSAAEAIDQAGAGALGAARGMGRALDAARARPWAVVAVGGALGAGVGGLLGQTIVRRRRAREPRPQWGEALERIWATATEPAGTGGEEARR
jgi:hypothetical protein